MSRCKPWILGFGLAIALLAGPLAIAQEPATDDQTEQLAADEMVTEGLRQLQSGDMEEAAATFEKVVKADPKNFQAMIAAAQAYMAWGVEMAQDDRKAANKPLRRAAELMRMMKQQKTELSRPEEQVFAVAVYNEACCAAVDGDADNAIKFLNEAIDAGFDDLETLENDSDFASIRNDDRFQAAVQKLSDDDDEDHNQGDDDEDHDNGSDDDQMDDDEA
jgi:tetratricopeptide (TPR) repeat protein